MATTCAGARWGSWPSPLGLSLGLLSVVLAQAGLILFHFARLRYSRVRRIQKDHRPYDFLEGVRAHLSSPGGMVMLACYLSVYWMADAMPCSYYSFEGGVRWSVVFGQVTTIRHQHIFPLHSSLLSPPDASPPLRSPLHVCMSELVSALVWCVFQICSQDFFMFVFHYLEHKGPLGPSFYQFSHKPHHRFVNPRLFDAFNGSVPDTFCMILIPLVITSRIFNANVWEYMVRNSSVFVFGTQL